MKQSVAEARKVQALEAVAEIQKEILAKLEVLEKKIDALNTPAPKTTTRRTSTATKK